MNGIDPRHRVAVVTGAARGIGRATAAALRDAGATVAIGDIDNDELDLTAKELDVFAAPLDVTDPRSVAEFHAAVETELGPVEIWINNAGIMPVGSLLEQSDAVIRRTLEINVLGVVTCTRVVARRMVEHGGGRIVNIASVAGRVPAPGMAVYNATKFAVVGFGEATDAELSPRGVRVTTVLPSFTNTGLIDGISHHRLMTPVSPADVANAVLRALRRGRRQIVVPRELTVGTAVWLLLPRPIARWLRRASDLDTVFLTADTRRAGYDARIAAIPPTDDR